MHLMLEPNFFQNAFWEIRIQDSSQKKGPIVKYSLQITVKFASFLETQN